MFEQIGAFLDQVIRDSPDLVSRHGIEIFWTVVVLFALRSFVRSSAPY